MFIFGQIQRLHSIGIGQFLIWCAISNEYMVVRQAGTISWSGHGKSTCDGVGCTAKRNADIAIKQSKAVKQDAHDFYAWAKANQSEISYQLITQDEYNGMR